MRLLELWQRLEAGERSIEMLPPLRRLATLSMAERGPWLPTALALAKAEEPELRAAAIALLDGTTGVPGLRHIVDALDDDDAGVREAAIAALASCCVAAPSRWAHAIFHARVEVRQRAVALTPEPARWMLAWARADPQLAGLVQGAPWPADSLPLVCDLWRLGAVSATDAAAALTAVTVEQLRAHLTLANRRDVGELARFLAAAEKSAVLPKITSDDALDPLLEILVAAGDAGRAGWGALYDAIIDPATPELRPRATLSACAIAGRTGWCEPLAKLALMGHARWLAFPFVPAATRRGATQVIWSRRDALANLPNEIVAALLASDVVRDESGAIDVLAAAPIVALLESKRVYALVEAVGYEALRQRVREQPTAWDAICRLPLESDHLLWLDQISRDDAELHARACAIAVKRWIGGDAEQLAAATMALESARVTTSVALLRDEGEELASHEAIAALVKLMLDSVAVADLPAVLAAAAACAHDRVLARGVLAGVLARNDAAVVDGLLSTASADTRTQALAWIREVLVPDPTLLEALAQLWRERDDPELRAFAARILRPSAPAPAPRAVVDAIQRLPSVVAERIASCDEAELADAVAPAMSAPCFGLTDALARRARPTTPNLAVCAALLACVDGLAPVARELARFGADDPAFDEAMLHAALALWKNAEAVPPLVDATLIAFDRSALGFAVWLDAEEGGHFGALRFLLGLPSGWVRRITWHAVSQVLSGWMWRGEHRRVARGLTEETLPMLVGMLDTDLGESAARIIVALYRGHLVDSALARMRPRVLALAPACTRETLHALSGWLPLAGVTPRGAPSRRVRAALPADERSETRASRDIGHLAQLCRTAGEATVREAVARLTELGTDGLAVLAELLVAGDPPFADLLRESIASWPEGAALARVRAAVDDDALAIDRRYRLALALAVRLESRFALRAVELLHASAPGCVGAEDWERLCASGVDVRALAERALECTDTLLVDGATRWALAQPPGFQRDVLLRRALSFGDAGSLALRRDVAVQLLATGDRGGLPWVIGWALDQGTTLDDVRKQLRRPLADEAGVLAERLVDITLLGGGVAAGEVRVVDIVQECPLPVQDAALARLLVDGSDGAARKRIVAARAFGSGRRTKLRELATVFAWGVLRGRELTGRRFSIHITPKREQWGYTHIGGAQIHVTPLPILAGERHGRDIVEGLILHEIGHHVWHAGKPAARVWKKAQKDGLFQLLNLVADEHLERNLRSLDADFGDRIKRLDAHAFQHAARELEVERLLRMLGGVALGVLAEIGPGVAFADTSVRIDSGRLLAELDRRGNSFARFVRALRMGLGNRARDPKVDAALAYFGAAFRTLDMHGLYRVTKSLAALFGDEARLAHGFGGHESIEWNERDSEVQGDGIADSDVQREVERILEPPRTNHPLSGMHGGRLAINVGAGAGYRKITKLQPLVHDPAKHRVRADPVRRHALRLRETLMRLGLNHRRVNARLRGHTLDRGRVRSLVTRGDPRILRARELKVASDLFLGVIVDCSGSMSGANLERARSFAVLIAEAARGLVGVDARFFGFTDTVIYEAGDAQRCAASSLEASGGNNDAAALDHVARVAQGSLRRAKLLVMISDGLPTECSVAALRNVVQELTRRHRMCCAQVAVRPLEEICFPHYVLLDDANLDVAVRRFAELVGKLVGRALSI